MEIYKNLFINSLPVFRAAITLLVANEQKIRRLKNRIFAITMLLVILGIIGGFSRFNMKEENDFGSVKLRAKSILVSQKIRSSSWRPLEGKTIDQVDGGLDIKAGAVVNINDGKIVWQKNLKQKIAPASLTRLVTLITALDLSDPNQKIVVDEDASNQPPTKLGLKTGEELTLGESVDVSILTASNDATAAIANHLGKVSGVGLADIIDLMNQKLQKIGATDSHLTNATGLDDQNQFSTVFDLAIIAKSALEYAPIKNAAAVDFINLKTTSGHRSFELPNWNALLGVYPGVNGLTNGYSENGGYATIVTSTQNGVTLMAIVVGAKTIEGRELAAASLLNNGFEQYGIAAFNVTEQNLVQKFEDWRKQLSYLSY